MKTTKFSRLLTFALVLAIALCCAIGIMASAEDAEPVARIDTANVAYNEMVQLAFTVAENGTLPEGADLGIMFWAYGTSEFTAETALYSTYTECEKDGVTYYKSRGIAAPEMDTLLCVAAVYKLDGAVTVCHEPIEYSVLKYAGTRLAGTDISAKQAAMYENLIHYGINSDTVLEGEENYAFVKAVNGTVGNAGAKIGGWAGKEMLLRAEAKNGDGEYFIKWVNEAGETVSNKRLAYVTAPDAGIAEYTAIFGERSESLYANTYNFEYLNTGKITAAPSGMNSISNPGDYNGYYITESADGDKQLLIDRINSGANSYGAQFSLPATQVTSVEYDLEFTESIAHDVLNNIYFYLKDADGTSATVRLNINYSAVNNNFYLYMESNKWTSVTDEAGKSAYLDAPEGSTVTFTFTLDLDNIREVPVEVVTAYKKDAEGNYLDAEGNITTDSKKYVAESTATYTSYTCDLLVYANGKYFGKVDLNACDKSGYYKAAAQTFDENGTPSFKLDKSASFVTRFGIGSLSAASKDISLDNAMYYDLIDETAE